MWVRDEGRLLLLLLLRPLVRVRRRCARVPRRVAVLLLLLLPGLLVPAVDVSLSSWVIVPSLLPVGVGVKGARSSRRCGWRRRDRRPRWGDSVVRRLRPLFLLLMLWLMMHLLLLMEWTLRS